MTITNGYCTLAEIKQRLKDQLVYTATTISFTGASKTVSDTAYGLKRFQTGDIITISGSTINDGTYTVATGNTAGSLITTEALAGGDEVAGDTVTITVISSTANPISPVDDAMLEACVEGASRAIDQYCHRRFYAAADTRYYTPLWYDLLFIDDLLSVTSIKTDEDADRTFENTWTASADYYLEPYNATSDSPAEPYTMIRVNTDTGSYSFPVGVRRSVEVKGSFGYAATTPPAIKQACLLLAARLYARRNVIFGVAGNTALGQVTLTLPEDNDVKALLKPYVKQAWGYGR